jgi:hypothetical protein
MFKQTQYHWTSSYNLTGVIEGFYHQALRNTGVMFQGSIHMIVFEHELLEEIEYIFSKDPYLVGWLPTYDNKKSNYSFLIVPEILIGRDIVVNKIPNFKDYVYLKINLSQNPHTKEMVVMLEEELVEG